MRSYRRRAVRSILVLRRVQVYNVFRSVPGIIEIVGVHFTIMSTGPRACKAWLPQCSDLANLRKFLIFCKMRHDRRWRAVRSLLRDT
eukprot:1817624-Rhodomonas_salina.1